MEVTAVPRFVLRTLGLVMPMMREIGQMSYQFEAPYFLDSSAATAHFGITPTPWDEVCARTLEQ